MSKRKQRKSQESFTPPPFTCPAVSVIIPLYNAEKYLAECLESILAQTFQNFEVIVVDDCSTDSSCAIVESYMPKFGGRLTLSHMETNSGSGALPRNKGLMLSRGEYIFFMDADDMFTKTALEEMYTLAKDYDADVVYCEKYFEINDASTNTRVHSRQKPPFVNEPLFETENLAERVEGIYKRHYWVTPWDKFVRRRLIFEREIFFPHVVIGEDDIWTYGLVFYAKKFLRVPNIVYFWRQYEGSMGKKKMSPQQAINFWINPVLLGLKSLDDLMSHHEFFRQNLPFRYAVLEKFVAIQFNVFFKNSLQLPPFEFYETIKQKFGDKLGEYDVLICALCTALNTQQKINAVNQQQFQQFAAHAQEQVNQFNQFAAAANERIAELEDEIKRLKS